MIGVRKALPAIRIAAICTSSNPGKDCAVSVLLFDDFDVREAARAIFDPLFQFIPSLPENHDGAMAVRVRRSDIQHCAAGHHSPRRTSVQNSL